MEAEQRASIISQARKMIVQTGIRSLRMDDVARATHVSKRTIYETFGDKEELLYLAAKEHFDIFESENIKAAQNATNILVAMLVIMEEIRKSADVNWQIRSELHKFYPNVNKRLWDDNSDVKRRIVSESIRSGVRQGYIQERINIPLTMNMFTYIAIGITEKNEMLKIPAEISTNDAFQEVLINYIRGISTIKGIEAIDEYLSEKEKIKE